MSSIQICTEYRNLLNVCSIGIDVQLIVRFRPVRDHVKNGGSELNRLSRKDRSSANKKHWLLFVFTNYMYGNNRTNVGLTETYTTAPVQSVHPTESERTHVHRWCKTYNRVVDIWTEPIINYIVI